MRHDNSHASTHGSAPDQLGMRTSTRRSIHSYQSVERTSIPDLCLHLLVVDLQGFVAKFHADRRLRLDAELVLRVAPDQIRLADTRVTARSENRLKKKK